MTDKESYQEYFQEMGISACDYFIAIGYNDAHNRNAHGLGGAFEIENYPDYPTRPWYYRIGRNYFYQDQHKLNK